jgi:hypothetical protein
MISSKKSTASAPAGTVAVASERKTMALRVLVVFLCGLIGAVLVMCSE